ncbi:hypothetical protein D3C71_1543660 [compost metagenome]
MDLISASTICLAASPITRIETTEAMPIIMPSMVSAVRILLAAIARQAITKASRKRPIVCCQDGAGVTISSGLAFGLLCPSGRESAMISPSRISMIRSACWATAGSWVTIITVCPCSRSCLRMVITSSPEWLSRAPVGSSARIT